MDLVPPPPSIWILSSPPPPLFEFYPLPMLMCDGLNYYFSYYFCIRAVVFFSLSLSRLCCFDALFLRRAFSSSETVAPFKSRWVFTKFRFFEFFGPMDLTKTRLIFALIFVRGLQTFSCVRFYWSDFVPHRRLEKRTERVEHTLTANEPGNTGMELVDLHFIMLWLFG